MLEIEQGLPSFTPMETVVALQILRMNS